MEMPPDTLEAVGINELFVEVGVDASFTTEQAASASSGTPNTQNPSNIIINLLDPPLLEIPQDCSSGSTHTRL
jgi:hypothetical protein